MLKPSKSKAPGESAADPSAPRGGPAGWSDLKKAGVSTAIGIGSAAIVAALLYTSRSGKARTRAKRPPPVITD